MSTKIRTNHDQKSQVTVVKDAAVRTLVMCSADMWEQKRANQRQDIEGLKAGTVSSNEVNWFAGGVARRAKLIGSIF
ncbi:hypothetical protein [Rhodoferax fermentans]|uniref:Uncharacterized protein n=1 Tax=Rhodoferax fermentans TaxID=28066 RepID=A0A1T1ANM1_RHOFE|nr:hypothetical protein [Rhodoferax fermentans]MBK1683113.1 hypothetical protein [Rhodoferax fermentans]OOV05730.1 hypothetical protein RF819_02550 [Rhodoferax fermentans]